MKKSIIFTLLFVFVAGNIGNFFSPKQANACSCLMIDTTESGIQQSVENASIVFVGTAESVSMRTEKIDFDVRTVYKGEIEKKFTTKGARDSASCGWVPEIGVEYLVYVYEHDGEYSTSLCSPNHETPLTENEKKVFGDGHAPTFENKMMFWQSIKSFIKFIFLH